MKNETKVLSIQDLSCFGQCSTSVFLPLVTAFGLETSIIPTSLFSAHTGAFLDYLNYNLTETILPIATHLAKNKISFGLIHLGFIQDEVQFVEIKGALKILRNSTTKIVLDPILGDNGKLYTKKSKDLIILMRDFIPQCECLTPNLTEACFLAGIDYSQRENAALILHELNKLGANKIVLKGIKRGDEIGVIYYDCKKDIKKEFYSKYYTGFYQGCGDILSAIICGLLGKGLAVENALPFALNFIEESIKNTPINHNYGVCYEQVIHLITAKFQ